MSGKLVWSFVVWSAFALSQSFANAPIQLMTAKLTARNPTELGYFGASVSVHGDTALISSPEVIGIDSIHEFRRDTSGAWHEVDEFTNNNLGPYGSFGYSVAHWENNAVVGHLQVGDQGGAYFYSRGVGGEWELATEFVPGDTKRFVGASVDMWGETAVVGAPAFNGFGEVSPPGKVFVVEKQGGANWSQITHLTPSDSAAGDDFGEAVAIEENRIIVGAPGAGSVYVFEDHGSGWQQVSKIELAAVEKASLGTSVALSGDFALLGTWQEAAYLFRNDGSGNWQQLAKFTRDNYYLDGFFGTSVALEGNLAAVGTRGHYVHLFRFDTNGNVTPVSQLAIGGGPYEWFNQIAFAGSQILVGHADAENGPFKFWSGATYVYNIPEPTSLWIVLGGLVPLVVSPRRGMQLHR